MFDKVLVANRGEIACRVLRTLRRLSVRSVAIYSEVDRHARHVLEADEAICVGPPSAQTSYLDQEAIVEAARHTGAEAIHPGYGFLSENPDFAESVEQARIAFVGPTPAQMRLFGRKHQARAIAAQRLVPLLPGSELLADLESAQAAALAIGFPVMIKSTAGGGGIGMQLCREATDIAANFAKVQDLARRNFDEGGIFLERFVEHARHIEVQIFGDGKGRVIALGERDCSAQRRHQKVVEETPAPRLTPGTRQALHSAAVKLGRAANYRSAGTVEFVYDEDRQEFYFLEVNTRLQVEHGVTELVFGIDIVEWMLRLAAGDELRLESLEPRGHAIEARLYAEDPARGFRPCAGLLTEAVFPNAVRVDGWVESGTLVSGYYDPMLAKVLILGTDRQTAVEQLASALDRTRLSGIETNLGYLRQLVREPAFQRAQITTSYLETLAFESPTIEVLAPGTLSTVQEYPGRIGYWNVGIPPSGPMDDLGFRLANRAVGNAAGTAALEFTLTGPTLEFAHDAIIALGGAEFQSTLDGCAVPRYRPTAVRRGQVLRVGAIAGSGCRAYLAVRHGFDVPEYLGSRATFPLGGFGGHGGRSLRKGDILHLCRDGNVESDPIAIDMVLLPEFDDDWTIGVSYGPHGAPDFFLPSDIDMLFTTDWEVHYNSARTGVRLIGPKPQWARPDGGEAGLHPSNLHDNAYAIGSIDFTGDMPILLGPDGPSLGGFVCPATVVAAERWKLGQLKPGARVRFMPISLEQAVTLEARQLDCLAGRRTLRVESLSASPIGSAVSKQLPAGDQRPQVTYRAAGDKYLLIEYGPMVLDLALRLRVHVLMQHIASARHEAIIDLTPGIRSLQVHYDSRRLTLVSLLDWVERIEAELPSMQDVTVPSRIVHLPLSWDDPATRLAIEKYMQGVRRDAPWTPSNLEFIRRINGLVSIDDVKQIVFDASYLVLGLGDVYLGAPVATPLDPRHRLVTTKYNPARTWTPENAVGIGGAYLCVYGMEGPGGYQFVGRTIQMFNRFKVTRDFPVGRPWLLRCFDQIRFFPVSPQELLEMREDFPHGVLKLRTEEVQFCLAEYHGRLAEHRASIDAFKARQQSAFDQERARWHDMESNGNEETPGLDPDTSSHVRAQAHLSLVESHAHGSVWKVLVKVGDWVSAGDPLVALESMKMELVIEADCNGRVCQLLAAEGQPVAPGQVLLTLTREDAA